MQYFLNSLRPLLNTSLFVAMSAIVLCLVLGGATRGGFLADAALQLLSIPLLMITLLRWANYDAGGASPSGSRSSFILCGLIVLLPLMQVVPLPPALWSLLGGRGVVVESFEIMGQALPWRPISVAPHATWFALLSFIPAITVFLATLQVGWGGRRILTVVVIVFGGFSVCYGLLQVAQGPGSPLRLFAVTNADDAVGLFANRNHFAALLYCVLALVLAWAIATTAELAANADKGYPTHLLVPALLGVALVGMLMVAQGAARSRAGIGLTVVLLVLALMLPQGSKSTPVKVQQQRLHVGRYAVGGIFLVFMLAGSSTLMRVLERFDSDPLKDWRIPFGRNTIEAALAHMPFGSGIGTFPPVYAAFEKAGDVTAAFANRAHNDILEAWLEAGIPGIAVFALFVVWLAARAIHLFRQDRGQGMSGLDGLLAISASAAIVLLLLHSLVDYPLRTAAMSGLFAFFCALLLPPPPQAVAREEVSAGEISVKHRSGRKSRDFSAPHYTPPGDFPPVTASADGVAAVAAPTPLPNWNFPADPSPTAPAPLPASGVAAWPAEPTPQAPQPRTSGSRWGDSVSWPDAWTATPEPPANPAAPGAPNPSKPGRGSP